MTVRRTTRLPTTRGAEIDYVLPLKWTDDGGLAELTDYLRWLSTRARVIVVDGSCEPLFSAHRNAWCGLATHVPPDDIGYLYGKVDGVHTGLRLAAAEHVVIGDDDVRYDDESLRRVVELLDGADLVGPQNVFDPLPWHAAWDTARSLLNRALAADYPGTFAVRRSTFLRMGGYNGDLMFENLELMRTVRAAGGRVVRPLDVFVVRRPPSARWFATQRVRQAYDDLAQPWRMAFFLSLLPAAAALGRRRLPAGIAASSAAAVLLAEVGRRRGGGRAVFPVRTALFAPAWVAERALCSWLALGQRIVFGGVRYRGQRLPIAAHSNRSLRRAQRARAFVTAERAETPRPVGAVAERLQRRATAPAERDGRAARIDLAAVGVQDAYRAADD